MKLTDLTIRQLKAPAKGATIYYDDTLSGFGVRVSEGGTKSFILTHGPRRSRETLGRVGIVKLQDARQAAKRRLSDWTLHDLRRTFASKLASLGISLPVVEKLLNHISGSFAGVVGVYQRYDFMPEMRDAVQKWNTEICRIVSIPSDNGGSRERPIRETRDKVLTEETGTHLGGPQ